MSAEDPVPLLRLVPPPEPPEPPDAQEAPRAQLEVPDRRRFILAGDAILTLVSQRTGQRYTFRVTRKPHPYPTESRPWIWFVSYLVGPDNADWEGYAYLGRLDARGGQVFPTKASPDVATPVFTAARWAFPRLLAGQPTPQLEVWHAGRCGRCGKLLTVPESIARGLGPICAEAED